MAVVGSTLTIDVHFTADTDADSVRGAMRENRNLDPKLGDAFRSMIDREMSTLFDENDIEGVVVTSDLELIDDRVAGAPRERVTGDITFEGEESALAAVNDAIDAPDRARLADESERVLREYLDRQQLDEEINVTVSVTPLEFK